MKYLFYLTAVILILIININLVFAIDFSLGNLQQLSSNAYKGDMVNFKGEVQADSGNYCDITCQFVTGSNSGYVSDSGGSPPSELSYGVVQEFPFSIRADGNGFINQQLSVTCDRVVNYINCWPVGGGTSATRSINVNFSFLYAGDGTCTLSKEKCANYQGFIGTSDCNCGVDKECRPDGARDVDEMGCQGFCGNKIYEPPYEDCSCWQDFNCSAGKRCKPDNIRPRDSNGCAGYCGNNICEKPYENCSSCSSDCKKCDLSGCNKNSDCDNGFCVWGICWNNDYRINDSHCDSGYGENCANSPADCGCESNKKCNNAGYCETYCGNGICEASEVGICKQDCRWCGDGICQATESCSSCEIDCNRCRIENDNNNLAQNTTEDTQIIEYIKKETDTTTGSEDITNENLNIKNITQEKNSKTENAISKNFWYLILSVMGIVIIGLLIVFIILKEKQIKDYGKKGKNQ